MSKLTRTLVVGATLAAISLAGTTTVAQAADEPTNHHARRPPTQGRVGEAWHQHPGTAQQPTAADAALGRVLARERSTIPNQTSAQVPAPAPDQPNGHSGRLLAALGVLAVGLVLGVGLAVLAARRARRRVPSRAASLTR